MLTEIRDALVNGRVPGQRASALDRLLGREERVLQDEHPVAVQFRESDPPTGRTKRLTI